MYEFIAIVVYGFANLALGWYVGKNGIAAVQADVAAIKAKLEPTSAPTPPAVG